MQKFIARQPILARDRTLFGYELLFRAGIENSFGMTNPEGASVSMADTSFLIGLQQLAGGRRAFINCTREFLLQDYVSLFPPDLIVVEVLETITPDEEIVAACERLKERGYLLALDDFVYSPAWDPLVAIADIIKIDFRLTSRAQQRQLAVQFAARGIRMLAEKVESNDEFAGAKQMGYGLFQGYFFCKPEMLQEGAVPPWKLAYLRLLREANESNLNIQKLATRIKEDPSLTFKLLRYLNSAAFGLREGIRSVAHALAMLGERDVRKWVSLVAVAAMAGDNPGELMTVPLVRGRFCELLAPVAGMSEHSDDLFLMGLLSVMDAILGRPLRSILASLPVRQEIKDALLEKSGPFRGILDIALAHESGDWTMMNNLTVRMPVNESKFMELYILSVEWAASLGREAREPVSK
jgi:c-di-GMP-related signal transduction protein